MRPSSRAEPAGTAADPSWSRLVLPAVAGLGAAWVLWHVAAARTPLPARLAVGWVPIYVGLVLVTVVLHAARWRMVLRRLGTELPLGLLGRLWLAARAVGWLIPSGSLGGEPVRAQLLTTSGMPAPSAAGAVAFDRALELAGNTIVGPLFVAVALALGAGSDTGALAAGAFALAGLTLLALVYIRGRRGRPALVPLARPLLRIAPARWSARIRAGAADADAALHRFLAAHPDLVPAGVGISLAIEAVHVVELAALFAAFSLAVPLPLLLLSSLGLGIAHAIPVTAALGTLEATQIGLFTVGGEPLATGLAVALAIRLAETLAILTGLACLATAPRAVA